MSLPEPLTTPSLNRYVIAPIRYPDIWELYQKHKAMYWNESEIDLSEDRADWDKLTPNEQYFLKHVLAFFAASDGIVLENLAARFLVEVQIPEARAFYSFQMAIETIHSVVYAQLINTYIADTDEQTRLFKAMETIPVVEKKAGWARRWIESSNSFAERLVAFICVEGIFFSGSFCAIFWLRSRALLPGMRRANDLIARDEGLHQEAGEVLYQHIVNRLSTETVHAIVREAVSIEEEFIVEAIPCALLGMNADSMREYIRFIANRILTRLGYPILFKGARQPFAHMERVCFSIKGNHFEDRITEYQHHISNEHGDTIDTLSFDASF